MHQFETPRFPFPPLLSAVKKKGGTTLYSRRGNILNKKFPYIATALKALPDDTILDGEIVALDGQGRSDFNLLQNFRSAESKIHYYVFDILALKGEDVSTRPLTERRKILAKTLKPNDHISSSPAERGRPPKIWAFGKEIVFEGVSRSGWTVVTSRAKGPERGASTASIWA